MKKIFTTVQNNIKETVSKTSHTKDLIIKNFFEILEKAGIDKEVLNEIFGGGLLIKNSTIKEKINEALKEYPEIKIKSFFINHNGINLQTNINKALLSLNLDICVYIEKIQLLKEKQSITCKVKISKTKGFKLFDFFISPIIETLIRSLFKSNVDKIFTISIKDFKEGYNILEVDLKDIKALKKLLISVPLPLPLFGRIITITPIELLTFEDIEHSDKGLVVKAGIKNHFFNK